MSSIQERINNIVDDFDYLDDWLTKYEYVIDIGKNMPLTDANYKTDEYKIRGCQSQVWLRAEGDAACIHFTADSDAIITKGLIGLLLRVLNDQPAAEIVSTPLDFLDKIGMKDHLSINRKNGLDSMIKKLYAYASAQI